ARGQQTADDRRRQSSRHKKVQAQGGERKQRHVQRQPRAQQDGRKEDKTEQQLGEQNRRYAVPMAKPQKEQVGQGIQDGQRSQPDGNRFTEIVGLQLEESPKQREVQEGDEQHGRKGTPSAGKDRRHGQESEDEPAGSREPKEAAPGIRIETKIVRKIVGRPQE